MKSALVFLASILFLAFLGTQASRGAEDSKLDAIIDQVIIHDLRQPVCEVFVSVADSERKAVKGLKTEDFQVRLDSVPVPGPVSATTFLSSGRGLEYLVLLEDREDMATSLSLVRSGLAQLFKNFGYRHHGAAAVYTGGYRLLAGFTAGSGALNEALAALTPRKGRAVLFDGLLSGVQELANAKREAGESADRRVVILLTEGLDEGSRSTRETLAQRLFENGISLYVLAYGLSDNPTLEFLENLAWQTHGGFWLTQPEEIQPVLAGIVELLNHQYILSFRCDDKKLDGSRASLSVAVRSKQGAGDDRVRFITPVVERLGLEWLGGLAVAALVILLMLLRRSRKPIRPNQKPNSANS